MWTVCQCSDRCWSDFQMYRCCISMHVDCCIFIVSIMHIFVQLLGCIFKERGVTNSGSFPSLFEGVCEGSAGCWLLHWDLLIACIILHPCMLHLVSFTGLASSIPMVTKLHPTYPHPFTYTSLLYLEIKSVCCTQQVHIFWPHGLHLWVNMGQPRQSVDKWLGRTHHTAHHWQQRGQRQPWAGGQRRYWGWGRTARSKSVLAERTGERT